MNKQQKITLILSIVGLVLSVISCCTVFFKTNTATQVSENQSRSTVTEQSNKSVPKTQDAVIVANEGGTSNDQSIKHIVSNDDPFISTIEKIVMDSLEVKEITIETTVKKKDNLIVSISSSELNKQDQSELIGTYGKLLQNLKNTAKEQYYSNCQITLQAPNSDGTVLEMQ